MKKVFVSLFAVVCFALPANTQAVTTVASSSNDTLGLRPVLTDWPFRLGFGQYDGSQGDLVEVWVTMTASVAGSAFVFNGDPAGSPSSTLNGDISADITLDLLNGNSITASPSDPFSDPNFEPGEDFLFDSVAPFASDTTMVSLTGADMAPFMGGGVFLLDLTLVDTSDFNSSANDFGGNSLAQGAGAEILIEYHIADPTTPPNPGGGGNGVPEPITATLGLMGLGVLGYATRRRA